MVPNPWGKTLRTDRYRFTVWTKEREGGEVLHAELYDHRNDPEESRNLVAEKPALVRRLLPRMTADGLSWQTPWTGSPIPPQNLSNSQTTK